MTRVLLIASALLAASCDQPQEQLQTIYAIDLSASIETRALEAACEAATSSLRSLARGDRAAVIPIIGDTRNEAQGRILRYRLDDVRQPYDGDLRRLAAEEKQALTDLWQAALRKPSPHTDLLGAVDLVAEEFDIGPKSGIRVLVLMSDFLHDDPRYRFAVERALADSKAAAAFAQQLASTRPLRLDGVQVFLGALASKDLARLSYPRREAVRAFWTTYLRKLGAEVRWATDGSGMVDAFFADVRRSGDRLQASNGAGPQGPSLAQLFDPGWWHLTGENPSPEKARRAP